MLKSALNDLFSSCGYIMVGRFWEENMKKNRFMEKKKGRICARTQKDGRSEIRNMLLKKEVFGICVTQEQILRTNSFKQAIERATELSL